MKKKVLVVGEYGIDRFVYGKIERINPEAPTPVLVHVSTKENLGMAGNVFENLTSLKKFNVDFLRSTTPAIKTRYVDEKSNYILLRVDENDSVARIEKIDESYISSFDAVVQKTLEPLRVIPNYVLWTLKNPSIFGVME